MSTPALPAYLAPLGLLRVLSAQRDPGTRLVWSPDCARWELTSDALPSLDAVVAWLAREYAPSPIVSPWNGRGGWWGSGRATIDAIRESTSPRLAAYRETVATVDRVLAREGLRAKPEGDAKTRLVRALRDELPDAALPWLDAVWRDDGERLRAAPLLGSGGNDSSYDYASHFARRVLLVLAQPEAVTRAQLGALVTGTTTTHTETESAGVLWPADAPVNPLAYVLALEGACLIASSWASAVPGVHPWQTDLATVGYDAAAPSDRGHGEVWLPYWHQDASLAEVQALLAEGWRVPVGDGLDAVIAATGGHTPPDVHLRRVVLVQRRGQMHEALDAGLYPSA